MKTNDRLMAVSSFDKNQEIGILIASFITTLSVSMDSDNPQQLGIVLNASKIVSEYVQKSKPLLKKMIKLLELEGNPRLLKPCDTNHPSPHCPHYPMYPIVTLFIYIFCKV